VQDQLAEEILGGRIADGQTVVVDAGETGLVLKASREPPAIDAAA
jgi:ATP-dependent Clp protease ATP-binding subunit ClpB